MAPANLEKNPENQKGKADESEQTTVQYLMETLQNLQRENETLKHDLLETRRAPSGKIGLILLAIGALALSGSVISASTVLAFIGLGLTFWGALFMFARPVRFVSNTLLDSTAVSVYPTIDRMIEDLGYKGKPVYISPFSKEAYLPEYLKGLREMIVFIPAEDFVAMPTIEEMAKKQFLLRNPKGICIAPPGYGLLSLLEKELKAEFTQIGIERLCNSLPTIVVKNLELAKEFEINAEKDLIHVKMIDSVYKNLYSADQNSSLHLIGCPLASAVAIALSKTTAKLVSIVKDAVSADLQTIEVWYRTLEA